MVRGSMTGGAFKKTGDGIELMLDFFHHLVGGLSDRLHGHGSKPVGDHSSNEQEGEHDGGQKGHLVSGKTGALHEGAEQGKTNEASRTNGEAFADGSGGVTGGIQ